MPAREPSSQRLYNLRNQPVEVHLADEVVVIGPLGSVEVAAGTSGQLDELIRRQLVARAEPETAVAPPPAKGAKSAPRATRPKKSAGPSRGSAPSSGGK